MIETTAFIRNGLPVLVTGHHVASSGDGWHEPFEPGYVELDAVYWLPKKPRAKRYPCLPRAHRAGCRGVRGCALGIRPRRVLVMGTTILIILILALLWELGHEL